MITHRIECAWCGNLTLMIHRRRFERRETKPNTNSIPQPLLGHKFTFTAAICGIYAVVLMLTATPADAEEGHPSVQQAVVAFRDFAKIRSVEPTTKSHTFTATDAPPAKQQRLGQFTITAYSLSAKSTGKVPGQVGFGVTSSGTHAVVGRTIAVDPSIIPIGTFIFIDLPGIGWRLAEDTGGAIRGQHIDLLLPSDAAAVRFGVKRQIPVYSISR